MSAADGLTELADRLYALPPAEFVTERDEAVKAARAAGDRSGAAAIGKLRRPTVAAWLVNLLALRRPDRLGALFDLGIELRAAQRELRGPALRELAGRRRAAVAALVAEACTLAVEAGASRSGLPAGEVEATLIAALADDELAGTVRAGRLLKPGRYDGFGDPARPQLQVIEGGLYEPSPPEVLMDFGGPDSKNPSRSARPGGRSQADAARPRGHGEADAAGPRGRNEADAAGRRGDGEAGQRLAGATAALADAEAAYHQANEAVGARTREVAGIEERLGQLRRDRVAAHAALMEAQATLDSADAERHNAQRKLSAAERAARRDG